MVELTLYVWPNVSWESHAQRGVANRVQMSPNG